VQDDRRVVVIGSGPPGATACWFLARAGIDVTLLEAGSESSARGLTVRVRGFTLASWRRPLRLRRDGVTMTADPEAQFFEEISPGGLTNQWSCAVPRFSREDFRDGERAGEASTWPIGYDDLATYYDQVEPLLQTAGSTTDFVQVPAGKVRHAWHLREDWTGIAAAARAQDRDVLPVPYTYGSETTVTLSGTVFNSFVRLVRPTQRTGHLDVRMDARVLRLEWSPEQRRVLAVIYRNMRTGREERVPCRAVIVAAGAINSARILLESSSPEFPDGLGNTEGVLGRYLHDHPIGKLTFDLGRPLSVHPAAYISRPSLARTEPLYAAACAQWTGTALLAKSVLGGRPGRMPWIGFNVFGTMAPTKDNGVSIDRARIAQDGSSGIALNIRHPEQSQRLLDETKEQLTDILTRAGLQPRLRVWKIEQVGNAIHYAGTCRMHASPRFGMLDGWSRMHAVPNVIVADSAAFTTGPEKNPVLTAMALAARASDKLVRDLRAGAL
jgi:choline dehydrogenase-like flavoprotein